MNERTALDHTIAALLFVVTYLPLVLCLKTFHPNNIQVDMYGITQDLSFPHLYTAIKIMPSHRIHIPKHPVTTFCKHLSAFVKQASSKNVNLSVGQVYMDNVIRSIHSLSDCPYTDRCIACGYMQRQDSIASKWSEMKCLG